MATINAFIRTTNTSKVGKKVTIRFRLTDGRKVQLLYKSALKVQPEHFDPVSQQCRTNLHIADKSMLYETNVLIAQIKQSLEQIYCKFQPRKSEDLRRLMKQLEAQKSKEMAEKMMIYGAQNKAKPVLKEKLLDLFEEFWSEKSRLVRSMQTYHALRHCIMRYEGYKGICFRVDMLTKEWVMNFEEYMNREWKILSERPDLANLCPSQRNVKPRGLNTIAKQMKSLSVFCNWLVLNKYLAHNPLLLYHKPAQVYGTPFF